MSQEIESLSLTGVLEEFAETYRDIIGDGVTQALKEFAPTFAVKIEEDYFAVEFIRKLNDEKLKEL